MAIDYNQEKKWAQKDLMKAANTMASVKMRLDGTKYHDECDKIMNAMVKLNDALVKEIRKMK